MQIASPAKPVIAAIVQARLGSSRLPLKSLLCLRDLPIIDWVCKRLSRSRLLTHIMVATSDTKLDQALAQHLQRRGIPCMAGPENDVLSRFRMAADMLNADLVVRVCADNPLIWWEAVDRLIEFYLAKKPDYAFNHVPRYNLWPDGLGAEIISAGLLRELDKKAQKASQREHCMNYIWDNAANFSIGTFDPVEAWLRRPNLKLDIDTSEDFLKLAMLPLTPDMDAKSIIKVARS